MAKKKVKKKTPIRMMNTRKTEFEFQDSVYFHATQEMLERLFNADREKTRVSFWPDGHEITFRFEVERLYDEDIAMLNRMMGGRLNMTTFELSEPPMITWKMDAISYDETGKQTRPRYGFYVEVSIQFSEKQWEKLKTWSSK